MGSISLHLDSWSLAWRGLRRKLAPRCSLPDCTHTGSFWRRLRGTPAGVMIAGLRYCMDGCLERALSDALAHTHRVPLHSSGPRRIPLGLLLLSRQQLTIEQLRAGLAAQRAAGCGRIGEWLQRLGFVDEHQVTAALARQWSCPVLRTESMPMPTAGHTPQIPIRLLESLLMVPVAYVEATATLHIAFGEGIDYSVLYALEQMLGCHTEACLAVPSFVRQRVQTLSLSHRQREILFDDIADVTEFARIVQSYSDRIAASEIRFVVCGDHIWVRLLRTAVSPFDLLMRFPSTRPSFLPAAPAHPSKVRRRPADES